MLPPALHRTALAALLAWGSACAAAEPPPNLLLVVVDTLRADHVGVYGHERATTPHVDALAREGVWFRRAYSHSGWTLPSMASLLTGRLPHEHRVGRDPADPTAFGSLEAHVPTLAGRLAGAGYRCGAVVNNTFLAPAFGLHRGFHDYDYRGATRHALRPAGEAAAAARAWIEGAGEPWFLLLHLMEPHLDYDPPEEVRGAFTGSAPPPVEVPFPSAETLPRLYEGPEYLGPAGLDYVRALYDEEILAADRALGDVLAALEERGRAERTVVVVTSDHGEEFYDHGSFEHGHRLTSELTRVPLVARGPGVGSGRVDALVEHTDLFRGLLSLAGVPAPEGARGVDLFALARGELSPGRRVSISENCLYGAPRASLVDGRFRLQVDLERRGAEVWRLDERGVESERLEGAELAREAGRLSSLLERERGHLAPVGAVAGPHVPDMDVFRELQSLGYLDGE